MKKSYECNHIAIILARGGSKRIPNKNIIEFCGRPMISWTIEAALKSNCYERVVVSTDCENIASIARENGAFVPFLRKQEADDMATSSQATIYTLNRLKSIGITSEFVTQLMPNCPLRSQKCIQEFNKKFLSSKAHSLITCVKFGWMNPWWSFVLDNEGEAKRCFNIPENTRSQDLETLYFPVGAIWAAVVSKLLKYKTFYMPKHKFYPIDWKAGVDIDCYDDLSFAQAIYNTGNYEGC